MRNFLHNLTDTCCTILNATCYINAYFVYICLLFSVIYSLRYSCTAFRTPHRQLVLAQVAAGHHNGGAIYSLLFAYGCTRWH